MLISVEGGYEPRLFSTTSLHCTWTPLLTIAVVLITSLSYGVSCEGYRREREDWWQRIAAWANGNVFLFQVILLLLCDTYPKKAWLPACPPCSPGWLQVPIRSYQIASWSFYHALPIHLFCLLSFLPPYFVIRVPLIVTQIVIVCTGKLPAGLQGLLTREHSQARAVHAVPSLCPRTPALGANPSWASSSPKDIKANRAGLFRRTRWRYGTSFSLDTGKQLARPAKWEYWISNLSGRRTRGRAHTNLSTVNLSSCKKWDGRVPRAETEVSICPLRWCPPAEIPNPFASSGGCPRVAAGTYLITT